MVILVIGLLLFVASHMIPCVPSLRVAFVGSLGENKYRALFSVVTVIGLVMIVWGYATSEFRPIYQPFNWGRSLALGLVPVALILFAAANMPTHIRAVLRHPMLLGLLIWAFAHLTANGDLSSLVLFGTLGSYALLALASQLYRVQQNKIQPRLVMDIVAIAAGIVVSGLLVRFHGNLFGVPIV